MRNTRHAPVHPAAQGMRSDRSAVARGADDAARLRALQADILRMLAGITAYVARADEAEMRALAREIDRRFAGEQELDLAAREVGGVHARHDT